MARWDNKRTIAAPAKILHISKTMRKIRWKIMTEGIEDKENFGTSRPDSEQREMLISLCEKYCVEPVYILDIFPSSGRKRK